MTHVSVAAGLGLTATLVLLSGGTQTSLAQVTLSPSCSLIDPLTGLCQTVTNLISPTPTLTATTTTTTSPSPISTTPLPTTSPVSTTTSGTTAPPGSAPGGTTAAGPGALNPGAGLFGGTFGSGAYGPGGLFYGASVGNYGGGTTYFAPNGQTVSSSQVYYQSAFGKSVSPTVQAEAVAEGMRSVPVASALATVPPRAWVLFPAGLVLLLAVTYLVLEVNGDETGRGVLLVR